MLVEEHVQLSGEEISALVELRQIASLGEPFYDYAHFYSEFSPSSKNQWRLVNIASVLENDISKTSSHDLRGEQQKLRSILKTLLPVADRLGESMLITRFAEPNVTKKSRGGSFKILDLHGKFKNFIEGTNAFETFSAEEREALMLLTEALQKCFRRKLKNDAQSGISFIKRSDRQPHFYSYGEQFYENWWGKAITNTNYDRNCARMLPDDLPGNTSEAALSILHEASKFLRDGFEDSPWNSEKEVPILAQNGPWYPNRDRFCPMDIINLTLLTQEYNYEWACALY